MSSRKVDACAVQVGYVVPANDEELDDLPLDNFPPDNLPLEGISLDSLSLEDAEVDLTMPDGITREQRRSRRKRAVRARTISVKRMTKRELEIGRLLYPEDDYQKPRVRSTCAGGARPCPYVSCKHHLYVDVSPRTGAIKLNFPDLEVWEMGDSCALDVADRGGTTLEDVERS